MMVEAEVENLNYHHVECRPILFAKTTAFLRFKSCSLKTRTDGGAEWSEGYGKENVGDYCFVQFYVVLQQESFVIRRIDKAIDSVRFQ